MSGLVGFSLLLLAPASLRKEYVLKKTITYEDFNGNEITEDFFFHLNKVEIVELEVSQKGGLSTALQRIIDAEDAETIISILQDIIKKSYGKKSLDGRRFVKNQEMLDDFTQSKAYEALFMGLVTDAEVAAAFMNGILPADVIEEAAKLAQAQNAEKKLEIVPKPNPEVITKQRIVEMTPEEIRELSPKLISGEVIIGE